MSDSALSSVGQPADNEIEDCLRRVVRLGFENEEDITVNKARELAEKELGLGLGYFKTDAAWKAKSKVIINETVAEFAEGDEDEDEDEHESTEEAKAETPKKPPPKSKPTQAAKTGKKRKSDDVPSTKTKRRKKDEPDDKASDAFDDGGEQEDDIAESKEDSGNDSNSFAEDATPVKVTRRKATTKRGKVLRESKEEKKPATKATKNKPARKKSKDTTVDDSYSEAEASPNPVTAKAARAKATSESEDGTRAEPKSTRDASELSDPPANISDNAPNVEHTIASDNESEMSVLIDDPPPKKKRKSKASASEPKAKATKSSTAANKKKGEPLTKNEEEIKRLQGWLVKCGSRKLWHRELANCDTEKAKIQHLKKMLDDAGMEGRPSNEKARTIKEARELREEIEAAQEFDKKWGQGNDDEGSGSEVDGNDDDEEEREEVLGEGKSDARPKRVLPKGFVDFGDSGDEDSD